MRYLFPLSVYVQQARQAQQAQQTQQACKRAGKHSQHSKQTGSQPGRNTQAQHTKQAIAASEGTDTHTTPLCNKAICNKL